MKQNAGPGHLIVPLGLAVLGCALLVSYGPALADLVYRWSHEPDYSHGFFVPLVALLLLWVRRQSLGTEPLVGSWWGLAGLGLSVLLRILGEYYYYALLHPISLLPALAGVSLLIGGRRMLVWAAPSIVFLAFMIPLPEFLRQGISLPLQRISTLLSVWLLQTLGQPAMAAGNTILINDFRMEVVAACSGLRLFVALSAMVTGYALFVPRPWREKILLLACVLPVAVVANVVRLTATGLFYQEASEEATRRMVHDGAGWIMIPLAVVLIGILSIVVRRLLPSENFVARQAKTDELAERWWLNRSLCFWLVGSTLVLLLAMAGVRHWQLQRHAAEFKLLAVQATVQRDWHTAAREWSRYVRLRPDDVEARIRLATTYDKAAGSKPHDVEAADLYRSAIEAAPSRLDLRHRYLELLLKLGRAIDAEHESLRLLAIAPADPLGKRGQALAKYMQWNAGRPLAPQAIAAELRAAAHALPTDAALLAALATLESAGTTATSENAQQQIVSPHGSGALGSNHLAEQLRSAMALVERGENTAAEVALRKCLQASPDDVRCHLAWIAFLKQTGRLPEAKIAVQEFQHVQLAEDLQDWMLAQAYEQIGEQALARKHYLAALGKRPAEAQLLQQVVSFFVDQERIEAEKGLREALKIAPSSSLLRQALALQLAKSSQQANWAESLALVSGQTAPGDLRVLATILLDHRSTAHAQDALALLEGIPQERTYAADRLLLARAYRQMGRAGDALKLLQKLAAEPAATEVQLLAYLDALLDAREVVDTREIDGILKRATERFSDKTELLYRIATYRFRQRHTTEAMRVYKLVLNRDPQHLPALNNLALLLSESPATTEMALQLLDVAQEQVSLAQTEIAGNTISPAAFAQMQDTRAVVLMRHGDPQGAVQLLEKLVAGPANVPAFWLHLALAQEQLGDHAAAKESLAKAAHRAHAEQWLTPSELKRLAALESK